MRIEHVEMFAKPLFGICVSGFVELINISFTAKLSFSLFLISKNYRFNALWFVNHTLFVSG